MRVLADIESHYKAGGKQNQNQNRHEQQQQQPADQLQKQKVTSGSKMVYVVLATSAIAFGIATYYLLSAAKEHEFQSESIDR